MLAQDTSPASPAARKHSDLPQPSSTTLHCPEWHRCGKSRTGKVTEETAAVLAGTVAEMAKAEVKLEEQEAHQVVDFAVESQEASMAEDFAA